MKYVFVQHVPAKTVEGYKCPTQGHALLWRQGMEEATEGFYTIVNGDIVLTQGFDEFNVAANIEEESILLVKVEGLNQGMKQVMQACGLSTTM